MKIRRIADFRRPQIDALIGQALELAEPPPNHSGQVVIKSISPKQRPRRPPA